MFLFEVRLGVSKEDTGFADTFFYGGITGIPDDDIFEEIVVVVIILYHC